MRRPKDGVVKERPDDDKQRHKDQVGKHRLTVKSVWLLVLEDEKAGANAIGRVSETARVDVHVVDLNHRWLSHRYGMRSLVGIRDVIPELFHVVGIGKFQ